MYIARTGSPQRTGSGEPIKEDVFPMLIRPKVPPRSPVPPRSASPAAPATKPAQVPTHDVYHPGDAIPVPEVIEKDSDSVWALWSDAIEGRTGRDDETQPATLLMGLPDAPKDREG